MPRVKDGEIIVYYGYAEGDGPDACVNWAAMQGGSANARFMLHQVAPDNNVAFFKELDERGFDLSTFRMSVQKKKPVTEGGEK